MIGGQIHLDFSESFQYPDVPESTRVPLTLRLSPYSQGGGQFSFLIRNTWPHLNHKIAAGQPPICNRVTQCVIMLLQRASTNHKVATRWRLGSEKKF